MEIQTSKFDEFIIGISGALIILLLPILYQLDDYLPVELHDNFIRGYCWIHMCFYMCLVGPLVRIVEKKNYGDLFPFVFLYGGYILIHEVSYNVIVIYVGEPRAGFLFWDPLRFLLICTFIYCLIRYLRFRKERKIKKEILEILGDNFLNILNDNSKSNDVKANEIIELIKSSVYKVNEKSSKTIQSLIKHLNQLK